jgi:hypothetical protein
MVFFKTFVIVAIVFLLLAIAGIVFSNSEGSSSRTSDVRPLAADLLQSKGDLRRYSRPSLPTRQSSQNTTPVSTRQDIEYSGRAAGRSLTVGADTASSGEDYDAGDLQFCPDLIVPARSECVLALPLDKPWSRSSFPVCDMGGKIVLIVQPALVGNLWISTVATENRVVLAKCQETRSPEDANVFELMREGKKCWGKMVYKHEDERYLITPSHGGVVWHFWGKFDSYVINITDQTNRLFATTELGPVEFQSGSHVLLRVAPETDVGLALCGLLCIRQHMENQKKKGRS